VILRIDENDVGWVEAIGRERSLAENMEAN